MTVTDPAKRLTWLMLATQVPPGGGLGGVVRYTAELTRALARRDDIEVHALAAHGSTDAVAEIVGDARRVSTVPVALPTAAASILERWIPLPAFRGMDVVQGTKHLVPHRVSRRRPPLRMLTIHDMLLLDRPADFGAAKRLLLPAAYRAGIRDSGVLICVSAATRARLIAHCGPAAGARSAVVPLATSPALMGAVPDPLAALAGRRFALVVGDASPRKNLGTLVEAWLRLRHELPDLTLAVAGPPNWARSAQHADYEELVNAGAVLPLGHVSDAQLRWAYQQATVVLCPSLAEGFGLPAAEALDLGAPVIISDDAALGEVAGARTGADVTVVAATDVAGWVAAVRTAASSARRGVVAPAVARSWDDVAEETVAAARRALAAGVRAAA